MRAGKEEGKLLLFPLFVVSQAIEVLASPLPTGKGKHMLVHLLIHNRTYGVCIALCLPGSFFGELFSSLMEHSS